MVKKKMKYNDCHPIETKVSSVWLRRFKDKVLLEIWHPEATIIDVVNSGLYEGQEFTVQAIDTGYIDITKCFKDGYFCLYSSDARKVTNNLEVYLE